MSRGRPKFPVRIQCWVPEDLAAAYEQLASDGLLDLSDHVRTALACHLKHLGITTSTPRQARPNGHQRPADHV